RRGRGWAPGGPAVRRATPRGSGGAGRGRGLRGGLSVGGAAAARRVTVGGPAALTFPCACPTIRPMTARRDYDAIIVGASFAGLAVARRVRGDVLLVDRHEVGAVQTSACGTPLWVPRWLGVESSVLQVHDRLDLRTTGRTIVGDRRVVSRGLGWVFPVGRGSLIGLGSYAGASRLGPALRVFLADLGAPPAGYHGTFFPSRLGRPTVGRLFAVGDAAGQCLPLTAEGIRPALYFGDRCGELIRRVLA